MPQGLSIISPRLPRPRAVEHRAEPSAAYLSKAAEFALDNIDRLIEAGEAARRAGSWLPGAAVSLADWMVLCDAEDLTTDRRG